jgi:hypothetical protein
MVRPAEGEPDHDRGTLAFAEAAESSAGEAIWATGGVAAGVVVLDVVVLDVVVLDVVVLDVVVDDGGV